MAPLDHAHSSKRFPATPAPHACLFAVSALALGFGGWPAAAAEQAEAEADVEVVLVTARRRAEPVTEVPAAITVLAERAIRQRGVTELNQLEKYAPNIVQTNFGQGNTGHAAVFMRGIGLQDHIVTTDPAVGIYLDGVYLGRNMGANMDLVNIERVEVLRGPQGSLSGRNTLGGALNIVTRKPAGDGSGRLDVKLGSLGRRNANFFADTSLGDTLALTVSGGIKSRDGVGRALGIANPEADIGQILQGFGRGALHWQATPALDVLLTADVSRSDQGVTPHAVDVFNPNNGFGLRQADQPTDPDDTYSLNNELMSTEDETKGYSLTVDWALSPALRLKFIGGQRSMWFEGGLDNEKVSATLIEFPERGEAEQETLELQLAGDAPWGDWVAGFYAFDEDGFNDSPFVFRPNGVADGRPAVIPASDFDGRLYLEQQTESRAVFGHANVDVGARTALGLGLRHTRDDKRPNGVADGRPAVIPASDFDGRLYLEQQTESRAVFGHANVDVGARTALGLGLRHTRDDKRAIGSLHYFPAPAERRGRWRETTGDATVTVRAGEAANVYVRYARGYQAGGYPPRPFGGPATFVAFDPTFADSWELGVKGTFANAQLAASAFHVRYTDLVVQVNELIPAGFLTLNQNAAASRANGLELEGSWQPSDRLAIDFAVGYIDVAITEVDERVQGIAAGDSPALTANYTLSLSPRYVWQTASGGAWTARVDAYRRGRMYGQPINTPLNEIAPLTLVSASLAFASPDERWTLALYGQNLTDAVYPLAKLDLDPTVLTINSNDRREIGLRFGRRFGD